MKRRLFFLAVLVLGVWTATTRAAISVSLTVQEALYPGSTSGVARSFEPVTVGLPLPDDAGTGATTIGGLSLSGATEGQFRILSSWPSGRIKWVLVDTLATVSAGSTNTSVALTSGATGNFGGSDLATDNGSTITIATGSATFTIKKANFNGFDQVVVGATTVVSSGASTGLVIMGPASPNTTCGTCTTTYAAANDSSSTASIEENGPVRAVVKATGSYKDGSGNAYVKFTVRMHFYKGLSRVKAVTSLQNADLGASSSFAVAYKGIAANEWRVTANISGTRTFQIGEHGGSTETGTLTGSQDVYLYQGSSELMEETQWDAFTPKMTTDSGYTIKRDAAATTLGSGTDTQYPAGWADIRDGSGVGMSIGVYHMAAYWPKSLEFKSGGSDVRIGIYPSFNSRTYHQPWPTYSTHDLYFNFHASALSSVSDEFLKFQHPLVARAEYTHYNTAAAFATALFPMVDPSVEQAFYQSFPAGASPTISTGNDWPYLDRGISSATFPLQVLHAKDWGEPGQGNQMEHRWSFLMNFITRGMTGRYLDAVQWYRFISDVAFPRSDGFSWVGQSGLDSLGRPQRTSANSAEGLVPANTTWIDTLHGHWYGMGDFYFVTGDEFLKDAMLDGVKDYYTATNTYPTLGLLSTTRAVAVHLIGSSRAASFFTSIGDTTTASTILTNGETLYDLQVQPTLCTEDSEAALGCTFTNNPATFNEDSQFGTSPLRGVHWSGGFVTTWCGASSLVYRLHSSFNASILENGLLEFREQKGTGWADYWQALDYAYGLSQSSLQETFVDGSGTWSDSGFRPDTLLDFVSGCASPEGNYDPYSGVTQWMHFYLQYLMTGQTSTWASKFRTAMQRTEGTYGVNWAEFGNYQLATIAGFIDAPGTTTLQSVSISSFVDNGGGSYTIGWTVPTGAQTYRIKWNEQPIVDWLNFDQDSYTYGIDPTSHRPWFSSTNVTPPAPASAGTTQTTTISTGETGLSSSHFSVKAYVNSLGGGASGGRIRLRIRGNE